MLTIEVAPGVRLEAEYSAPVDAAACVVLAHPHPLRGGSMDAGLIDELFRLLPAAGLATLRFNFRGVGRSTGTHDHGVQEKADLVAAIDASIALAGDALPIIACGWSFGGDVTLSITHPALTGWVGVAAPLRITDPTGWTAPTDPRPKLLLVPEHDQFLSPTDAAARTATWTNTTVLTLPAADHFLAGHARAVAALVVDFSLGPNGQSG